LIDIIMVTNAVIVAIRYHTGFYDSISKLYVDFKLVDVLKLETV